MSKIPTTEEFYKQTTGCLMNHRDIKKAMIEFAKLHVEAALKEASEKAEIITKEIGGGLNIEWKEIDKDSILNAYPLNLIR